MSKQEDVQKRAFDLWSQSTEGKAALQWEETQEKQKKAAETAKKQEEDARKAGKEVVSTPSSSSLPTSMSGNVIGVGANPVVTALQEQQAIAREQLACLQIMASQGTGTPSADLTNKGATPDTPANASPSRAALLTKKK
jgi:hypothetical protein